MNKRISKKREKQSFLKFVSQFKPGVYYYDCGNDLKVVTNVDILDDTLTGQSVYTNFKGNCSFRHCAPDIIIDTNEVEFAKFFYIETGFYFRKFYPYNPGLFTCSFKDEDSPWSVGQKKIWLHYFDLLSYNLEKYNKENSFTFEVSVQINRYKELFETKCISQEIELEWDQIISERDRYLINKDIK